MYQTNLKQTYLENANLKHANLSHANLEQADLVTAHLQQSNLWFANLRGVKHIETAYFDEGTILPDGEVAKDENGNYLKDESGNPIYTINSYWTPETDMTRYTNPEHPEFWKPDYFEPNCPESYKPLWLRKQELKQGAE